MHACVDLKFSSADGELEFSYLYAKIIVPGSVRGPSGEPECAYPRRLDTW